MKETARHQRAFEAYYGLGPKRSLRGLAVKLGVSAAAVKKWSKNFSWQERLADREEAVSGLVRERATEAEVDRRTRNQQVVKAGIITIARAIAEGRVKPTLADLDRLVRLESFLEGGADSRQEIIDRDLRSKSTAELRALLRKELAELRAIEAEFEVEGAGEGDSEQ